MSHQNCTNYINGKNVASDDDDELHQIIFGAICSSDDCERWKNETFNLSCHDKYGLVQTLGGPCGVLAAVQAYMICELMQNVPSWSSSSSSLLQTISQVNNNIEYIPLPDVTHEQSMTALRQALATIIWNARYSENSQAFWSTYRVTSFDELLVIITNDSYLSQPGSMLTFIKSIVRTRGITNVLHDMNDCDATLVQRFGHTSQELVNLCLHGVATPYVFDGKRSIAPGLQGEGIQKRCRVGLLSQLEVLQYVKVGNFSKFPTMPVWLIASSTHYTVIFSLDPNVAYISPDLAQRHAMLAEFTRLDQSESGFIVYADLPIFLNRIERSDLDTPEVFRIVDPDELGVLLFDPLYNFISQERGQSWSCSSCTFINSSYRSSCEICELAKQEISDETSLVLYDDDDDDTANIAPSSFTMYHYNGVHNHQQSNVQIRSMRVTKVDLTNIVQGQSAARGLREVLQTRWPNAIVDYSSYQHTMTDDIQYDEPVIS